MSPAERFSLQKKDFMEQVKLGVPAIHACFDVGWTVSRLNKLMRDKDFRNEVEECCTYRDEAVELVLYQKAIAGHTDSVKMWLENRLPDRWADKKRLEVQHSGGVAVAHIDATTEALKALLIDPLTRGEAVAALGPGGILDVEEVDVDD